MSQPITVTTWKSLQHELHQATVHILLNTPHDSSAKIKQLRGLYAQNVPYFLDALRTLHKPIWTYFEVILECGWISLEEIESGRRQAGPRGWLRR